MAKVLLAYYSFSYYAEIYYNKMCSPNHFAQIPCMVTSYYLNFEDINVDYAQL
jgi:hypothetical protein